MWDFLEGAQQGDKSGLFDLLLKSASELGFDRLAYGCLNGDFSLVDKGLPAPAITLNYPEAWVSHYFASDYQKHDPVVTLTPRRLLPFKWEHTLHSPLSSDIERQIILEADDCGLRKGISVPLHGPAADCFVLSFAMSEQEKLPKDIQAKLSVLAYQFHTAFMHHIDARSPLNGELSPNALEILK